MWADIVPGAPGLRVVPGPEVTQGRGHTRVSSTPGPNQPKPAQDLLANSPNRPKTGPKPVKSQPKPFQSLPKAGSQQARPRSGLTWAGRLNDRRPSPRVSSTPAQNHHKPTKNQPNRSRTGQQPANNQLTTCQNLAKLVKIWVPGAPAIGG